jgi:hypothetical protein
MESNKLSILGLLTAVATSTIVGGVVGFAASKSFDLYTFKKGQEYEMLRFTTDLAQDFYSQVPLYRQVRTSIEACADLYKEWGGRFDHDEINQYLGFFENLGYFYKQGLLPLELIDHFFGAHIVEASVNPQVRDYIDSFHTRAQQSAFADFINLANNLKEEIPERKALADETSRGCLSRRAQKRS